MRQERFFHQPSPLASKSTGPLAITTTKRARKTHARRRSGSPDENAMSGDTITSYSFESGRMRPSGARPLSAPGFPSMPGAPAAPDDPR